MRSRLRANVRIGERPQDLFSEEVEPHCSSLSEDDIPLIDIQRQKLDR
jgi:hypothetical protein